MNVLATLHIADLWRDPRMDIPTRLDWAKVPRILRGEWPLQPPDILVVGDDDEWVQPWSWIREQDYIVIDTEYVRDTQRLTMVGVGARVGDRDITVQFDARGVCDRELYASFARELRYVIGRVPVVFQNAMADVPILREAFGVEWSDYYRYEDTMQAHAVLYPEWPHDLEFLASIYGKYPKMKHLAQVDPLRYNQGDVLETISAWEALLGEFAKDPESERVYRTQNLRLLPHIEESERVGLRVNQARVEQAYTEQKAKHEEASRVAEGYCGYPINLGSDQQLAHWLYTIEGMPVQRQKDTRNPTVNKDAIAVLRGKVLPFDPQDEPSVAGMHERIAQGGHPLLEARVVYSGAEQVITHYLDDLMQEGEA